MQYDEYTQIKDEYFEWIYNLVCNEKYYTRDSYRKLLNLLNSIDFVPAMSRDDNRRVDGINFRYRFGYECGYSDDYIQKYLDICPCSVLEMMAALANRGEEEIMSDLTYGDRTKQWFWAMIISLGLGTMDDTKFDERYSRMCVEKFQNREYSPDGKGGLFTLDHPSSDLRDVEIWCQFMWYLDEIIED